MTLDDPDIDISNAHLTLKQQKFLAVYFQSGNSTQAAMEAYDCADRVTAASIGYENLRKLQIPVKSIMEIKGLSIGKLVDTILEGLKAINGAEPDYRTRLGYVQVAGKWLGLEAKDQANILVNQEIKVAGQVGIKDANINIEELAVRTNTLIEQITSLYNDAKENGESELTGFDIRVIEFLRLFVNLKLDVKE